MEPTWLQKIMDPWVLFGFAAQGCFAARFVWQWLVSEKRGRSTIPLGFWILSLCGGAMLFVYACYRQDPVFMAGQGLGLFIYARNLMLIARRRRLVNKRHPVLGAPRQAALADSDPEATPDGENATARTADAAMAEAGRAG